jgi:hypothetical protein
MRERSIRPAVVLGALGLLALLYWAWGRPERSVGTAQPEAIADAGGGGADAGALPVAIGPARSIVAGIRGRVRVESGALPPAQVCVTPATLELDGEGRGRFSALALLERCVATAEDGVYQIEGLVPGRYVVSAGADGYLVLKHRETPTQPWISLQPGQVREGLDFLLRVRGIAVRGVVRDVAGGTISGALVLDDSGARVLTGEDGSFTLWALPQSRIIVGAFASGYTLGSAIARAPQTPLTLWLTPESVLRGRVVQDYSGAALAGLGVHLTESRHTSEDVPDAETATDGGFELRGLGPGRYKPYVRSEGWCGDAEPSVGLGLGETSEPVTIRARPCRTLTAKVRVRPGGAPCSSAQIELLDAAGDVVRRMLADGGGVARLSGVEPGVYQARIHCPGHIQRAPESWVLGEAMAAEAVWEVEPGRTVRGVIRDHRGAGVPRANAEITGAWGYVGAGADDVGAFVATVQPGPAVLKPYSTQYGNGVALELEIPESRDPPPVVLEFPASSTGAVSGLVRARAGQLPPGLTVVARAIGNFGASTARVDEAGRYSFSGLDRIPHEIIVQRYGGLRERADSEELAAGVVVDLGERERAEANFVVDVPGLVALAGRVVHADASAEPDALVTVTHSQVRERTLTDEQGRFSFQVAGGTRYTVDVTARDGSTLQQSDVAPEQPLMLRFPATREVCGVVEADAPVLERFTVGTDAGDSERFAAGTQRWCLARVPVGARRFSARSPSFGAATRDVQVPAQGQVAEVVLRFAGRTSLRGKVLDAAGQPRPRFKVWVLDATGRLVGGNLYTDDHGEFSLPGVPAGELTVIPIAPGPFPGREALLERGTKIEVSAERASEPLVLVVP